MNAARAGLFAVLLLAGVSASRAEVQLQSEQSEIAFTTRQMGVPVEGRFARFTARVALDPKTPQAGSIAFTIASDSARFGAAEIEAEVVKPTWLAAAKFPQAEFQSTAIRSTGPGRFEVAGRLSIKGSTHEVLVPVQLVQAGGRSTASGSFTIRRLDFKVGDGDWSDTSLVANDVLVKFRLVFSGLEPP